VAVLVAFGVRRIRRNVMRAHDAAARPRFHLHAGRIAL